MKSTRSVHGPEDRDITTAQGHVRKAVGYIRVSTDMQANDGLSLDAQTSAIEQYCAMQGLRLTQIHKDVLSGGKAERPGLKEALRGLQRGDDILVVLKFDRLSRSIRHFCELYETYFRSGEKEPIARVGPSRNAEQTTAYYTVVLQRNEDTFLSPLCPIIANLTAFSVSKNLPMNFTN